jgi:RimJ/RimL family protein N-acetyltransferase
MTDPEVQRYFDGPLTPDVAYQRAVTAIGRPGKFCVALRATEEPIGFVGIGTEKRSGDLGVAYAFLPEHWGHGYAREAVPAVIAWVFDHQPVAKVRRIVGVAAAANERSIHLLESIGMTRVDTFDEPHGQVVMYAITEPSQHP